MRSLLPAAALLLLLAPAAARGQDTDEEVSRRLFGELIAPVADAAAEVGAGGIAVRGAPAGGPERRFFDAVGDAFLDRGYDVWVVGRAEPVAADVLALDLELTASEIDYPRQTRQVLGIGRAQVLRRVTLGARMRLTEPTTGRVLYSAEPVRMTEEWMSFREANRNAEQRPDWMGAIPMEPARARNPWWQRSLIVGVLGGVAILYFSGAN